MYVLKQKPDDSAIGDFIREAKADKSFPAGKSWWDIRLHLMQRDGGERSMVAARALWKAYRLQSKK